MSSTATLQIVIDAKNNAQKALDQLNRDVSELGGRFSTEFGIIQKVTKAAAVSVAALGVGTVAFGIKSVNAYRESQVAMTRFNTALATTGKIGEKAREELLKAADAATKLGFDDEDAAESLGKFFQRTKDVNQALKLNQVSMDLARAKNIELSDASRMVNLVLSGNAKALKEYGIELKEGQSPLKALAELQKQVAGQSAAFSGTLEGSMQSLSVSFGNLEESIGGALANAITPALQSLARFIQTDEVQASIQRFSDYIQNNLSRVVSDMTEKTKQWYQSIGGSDGLKKKFEELWLKMNTEIIPTIKSFGDSVVLVGGFVARHIDTIKDLVIAYEAIKAVIVINGVANALQLFITKLTASAVAMGGAATSATVLRAALVSLGQPIVITIGIASIIAATSAAKSLKNAMDDVEDSSNSALKSIQKLIDKANQLDKNDPKRKKLLEAAQKAGQSQSDIYSGLSGELSFWNTLFGRATGGSVMTGKPYLVGENGPEVFVPSQSGRIENGSVSGGTTQITVQFDFTGANIVDRDSFIQQVKDALSNDMRLASLGVR